MRLPAGRQGSQGLRNLKLKNSMEHSAKGKAHNEEIKHQNWKLKRRPKRLTGRQGVLASAQQKKKSTLPGSTIFEVLPFFSQRFQTLWLNYAVNQNWIRNFLLSGGSIGPWQEGLRGRIFICHDFFQDSSLKKLAVPIAECRLRNFQSAFGYDIEISRRRRGL